MRRTDYENKMLTSLQHALSFVQDRPHIHEIFRDHAGLTTGCLDQTGDHGVCFGQSAQGFQADMRVLGSPSLG